MADAIKGSRNRSAKYGALLDALRDRIMHFAPGTEVGTILGLRREFKVSQGPLDRALRELRRAGLIESRKGSGIYVTHSARLRRIGVFFRNDLFDPSAGQYPFLLLQAIRQEAIRRNVMLRYYIPEGYGDDFGDRMAALQQDILHRHIDGVIAIAVHVSSQRWISVPTVGMGPLQGMDHRVELDKTRLVSKAVRCLRDKGCRRLALLKHIGAFGGDEEQKSLERSLGAGLTTRPEWAGTVQGNNMVEATEAGYREFKALWNAHREKPDGLVSCDDYVTRGALQAMREMEVVPGKHLQIASHANKGLDLFGGMPVIRIEFDLAEIAVALIDVLMGCMDGKGIKATVKVSPHVVEERSEIGGGDHERTQLGGGGNERQTP